MKKILLFVSCAIILFAVSACGETKQSNNTMLNDLKLQNDVVEWNGTTFELTDCEIISTNSQGNDKCVFECILTKKNEEYEIVDNCSITYEYSRGNGWSYLDYESNSIEVLPLSGMNDEAVKNRVRVDYANLDNKNLTVSNIQHNFNKEAKTDTIVVDYSYTPEWYTKSGTVTFNMIFENNSWQVASHTEENAQMNWNLSNLIGVWQVTCSGDNYTVEFKITDVNTSNNTVTMQFRHAPHGFIAGGRNGSDLIKSEEYTAAEQYTLSFYEDKEDGPYIYIGTYEFYESLFDHDYSLYVDADSVYVPHGYKDYNTTRVE